MGLDEWQNAAPVATILQTLTTTDVIAKYLFLALLAVPLSPLAAQRRTAPPFICRGEIVSAIDFKSYPPRGADAEGVREKVEATESNHHWTTRPGVITAYLRLAVGRPCIEFDRAESERLLRAQPFISSANIRARPDGSGGVHVEVETVDEFPFTGSAKLANGTLSALGIGTVNLGGRGLTLSVNGERGFNYRNGFGGRIEQYGAFGRPDVVAVSGARTPLGDSWSFEYIEPFLTDLQPRGLHLGTTGGSDYYDIKLPNGDVHSLAVRRTGYDLGGVFRVGRGHTVGLLGAVLLGEDISTSGSPVIVSDSGFVPVTNDSVLTNRYGKYAVTRLAAIVGIRSVRFVTVRGFDALTGPQDMASGFQFVTIVGPNIQSGRTTRNLFVSGDLYGGVGNGRSFVEARLIAEGGLGFDGTSSDLAGSGKIVWYDHPSLSRLSTVSFELSGVQRVAFPLQLTLGDHSGGIRGYGSADFVGGQRAVARAEERWLLPWLGSRADVAVATFVEAGKLWAGDVPYGATTAVHSVAGLSLLGTYPSGGKRTYRVDFAFPINRDGGTSRFEVRLSSSDFSRAFWQEPNDIARARTFAFPVSPLALRPR